MGRGNFDNNNLLKIIEKYIKDKDVLWLVKTILENYDTKTPGKGMPLGNWTSQFFANVYLNELDQFVKHQLKAKYYIRYVDDFVILHQSRAVLQGQEQHIRNFLKTIKLKLHPDKSKIIPLRQGISFLGFRKFYQFSLVRPRNLIKIKAKMSDLLDEYGAGCIDAWTILDVLNGWNAYAMHANTFKLRQKLAAMVEQELQQRTVLRRQQVTEQG